MASQEKGLQPRCSRYIILHKSRHWQREVDDLMSHFHLLFLCLLIGLGMHGASASWGFGPQHKSGAPGHRLHSIQQFGFCDTLLQRGKDRSAHKRTHVWAALLSRAKEQIGSSALRLVKLWQLTNFCTEFTAVRQMLVTWVTILWWLLVKWHEWRQTKLDFIQHSGWGVHSQLSVLLEMSLLDP